MTLCHPSQIPEASVETTFRNGSWTGLLFAGLIMGALALFVALVNPGSGDALLALVPGGAAALLLGLALMGFRLCRKPTNWLLKVTAKGLYVNLRSYRNHHLPPDSALALHIPAEEVAAICRTGERRHYPRRRRAQHDYLYLDIFLCETDLSELRQALRKERRIESPPGLKRRPKHLDFPVRVLEPLGVRLVWEWIRPGENQAMDLLRPHFPVAPDRKERYPDWEELDEEAKEAMIADLWETGYVAMAVELAARQRGIDRREARRMLDARFGIVEN